jgi:hypothetical protein
MKVTYKNPNDDNFEYNRWFDNNGTFDIWYKDVVMLFDYKNLDIPNELKMFLDKWNKKILEYKETYIELYPVKLAHIEFIYNDVVYSIYPMTVSATYKTSFMSDEEYEVSWDSLFEEYQREIRDDLEKELGVKHSRYWGMLD